MQCNVNQTAKDSAKMQSDGQPSRCSNVTNTQAVKNGAREVRTAPKCIRLA